MYGEGGRDTYMYTVLSQLMINTDDQTDTPDKYILLSCTWHWMVRVGNTFSCPCYSFYDIDMYVYV